MNILTVNHIAFLNLANLKILVVVVKREKTEVYASLQNLKWKPLEESIWSISIIPASYHVASRSESCRPRRPIASNSRSASAGAAAFDPSGVAPGCVLFEASSSSAGASTHPTSNVEHRPPASTCRRAFLASQARAQTQRAVQA